MSRGAEPGGPVGRRPEYPEIAEHQHGRLWVGAEASEQISALAHGPRLRPRVEAPDAKTALAAGVAEARAHLPLVRPEGHEPGAAIDPHRDTLGPHAALHPWNTAHHLPPDPPAHERRDIRIAAGTSASPSPRRLRRVLLEHEFLDALEERQLLCLGLPLPGDRIEQIDVFREARRCQATVANPLARAAPAARRGHVPDMASLPATGVLLFRA